MKTIKQVAFFLISLASSSIFAQVKLTQSSSTNFTFQKGVKFTSFQANNQYYSILGKFHSVNEKSHIVVCKADGTIGYAGEVTTNLGSINNLNFVNKATAFANKAVVFVENHDKKATKNTLSCNALSENGVISNEGTYLGDVAFEKMMNPGNWFVSITPDKKHVAVLGQFPDEKEQPAKFKYYFFDENLKQLKSGEFTIAKEKKRFDVESFHASDKGDFYLLNDVTEKGMLTPVVYKGSITSSEVNPFPIVLSEPQKVFNYSAIINQEGNLIVAGYYHERKSVAMGEVQVKGSWMYSSASNEAKSFPLDKQVENLSAKALVQNGNTLFLVGEQYKEDRETKPKPNGAMGMDETYTYIHKNNFVTGFDNATLNKKFDVGIAKNWTTIDFNQDVAPAIGIMNEKMVLIFNDQFGKYHNEEGYANAKLPVLVSITNDGLMEQPIDFKVELNLPKTYRTDDAYVLFPKYFSGNNSNEMIMLAGYGSSVKSMLFKTK